MKELIDKICSTLTDKIHRESPEIDAERLEIIDYGLHIIIGEIPKQFIILGIAYLLGVFKSTLLVVLLLLPYRAVSGGFHLKTHIGCIVSTTLYYCGIAKISNIVVFYSPVELLIILLVWIFGLAMITLYAPADTENVPILRKRERLQKKVLSYIFFSIGLLAAGIIQNNQISNILIFGNLVQSIMISRLAYKLTNNKYGYEVYNQNETSITTQ